MTESSNDAQRNQSMARLAGFEAHWKQTAHARAIRMRVAFVSTGNLIPTPALAQKSYPFSMLTYDPRALHCDHKPSSLTDCKTRSCEIE